VFAAGHGDIDRFIHVCRTSSLRSPRPEAAAERQIKTLATRLQQYRCQGGKYRQLIDFKEGKNKKAARVSGWRKTSAGAATTVAAAVRDPIEVSEG
jgi:hypothetical protein